MKTSESTFCNWCVNFHFEIHKSRLFKYSVNSCAPEAQPSPQVCKEGHSCFPPGPAEHFNHHIWHLPACGLKRLRSDLLPTVHLHTLHRKISSGFNSNIKVAIYFMSTTNNKAHLFFLITPWIKNGLYHADEFIPSKHHTADPSEDNATLKKRQVLWRNLPN